MKNALFYVGVLVVMLLFSGCATKMPEYSVSVDNVLKLKEFENIKIGVEEFTSTAPNNMFYHGGRKDGFYCGSILIMHWVVTPHGESIEEFLQHAFEDELKTAGIYDKYSKIRIGVQIEGVDSSVKGNIFDHNISLQMTLKVFSTNGNFFKTYVIKDYSQSTYFGSVCDDLANSFTPFVRQLIGEIITNPEFPNLLK
ncbi:MAG: YajG family lipoprotein [Campylobacteraceae bacterium]|jgi:hypothetical protein|nr:YajG family lipoprotein [Campylobacteraceae bacterium]